MRTSRWLLVLALALTPLRAHAVIQSYKTTPDSAQSQAAGNCLVGSSAQGSGSISLDTATRLLSWNITFGNNSPSFDNGLLDQGAETAAHFHRGAPGVNGGIEVGLGTGSPKVGSTTISASQAADLQAGLWYVNIHSEGCVPGEIRGQVIKKGIGIPTLPSAVGVVALVAALAIGGLAWIRRARIARV